MTTTPDFEAKAREIADKRQCSISGCGKPYVAKGLCMMHYQRLRTHGGPLLGGKFLTSSKEIKKFYEMSLSYKGEDCLIWPFTKFHTGYAQYNTKKGKTSFLHRRICEEVHGSPPDESYQAAHSCGKGHLGCINPMHLSWKTPAENQADRIIHGTTIRGERHPSAKLNLEQVKEIRHSNESVASLSLRFGIKKTQVYRIRSGSQWRDSHAANTSASLT